MSATTQVRIRNREGVILTKNGTYLTHIEIDPMGQSDFNRSYLDLHIMFKDGTGNYIYGEKIYQGDINSASPYDGQCLIRNCRLSCDQLGILEENLKVNVYHQTFRRLLKNKQQTQSSQVFGNEFVVPDAESGMAHILVPLSSILGLGNQIYDNQRCGNSTLRLELEFQLDLFYRDANAEDAFFEMAIEEVENATGNPLPVSTLTIAQQFHDEDTANQFFYVGQVYTITGQAGDDEIDVAGTLQSISWNGTANEVSLTFEEQLFTLADDEVFDGGLITSLNGDECDPITIDESGAFNSVRVDTATATDYLPNTVCKVGAYDNADDEWWITTTAVIQTAVQDGADVVITFTENLASGITEGTEITGVFVVALDLNPVNWEVHQIDLVLHKLLQPMKMGKMTYDTWSLEQTNQPQTANYRKQFYTEPDVYKFAYLTPNGSLISEVNDANSYRFTLNNIDLTNRDIPIDFADNNSLYNDRLVMNVDGLASVVGSPAGTLTTAVYPDRCPLGQQNMVELQLSNINGEAMAGVVGHFFKIRARQV
jgi:hypothetical protein